MPDFVPSQELSAEASESSPVVSAGASGELSPEDIKLVTLARGARARAGAREGAAVLDDMGRSYAAASVDLAALKLSAVQAAVAAAVSSGSRSVDAAVVVASSPRLAAHDRAVLDELATTRVLVVGLDGAPAAVPDAGG